MKKHSNIFSRESSKRKQGRQTQMPVDATDNDHEDIVVEHYSNDRDPSQALDAELMDTAFAADIFESFKNIPEI